VSQAPPSFDLALFQALLSFDSPVLLSENGILVMEFCDSPVLGTRQSFDSAVLQAPQSFDSAVSFIVHEMDTGLCFCCCGEH